MVSRKKSQPLPCGLLSVMQGWHEESPHTVISYYSSGTNLQRLEDLKTETLHDGGREDTGMFMKLSAAAFDLSRHQHENSKWIDEPVF